MLESVRVATQRDLGTSVHFWMPECSLHSLHASALELLREVDLKRFARIPSVELSYARKSALYSIPPNLKGCAGSQGTWLSGGEQQMVGVEPILRAGANPLLLDEISDGWRR